MTFQDILKLLTGTCASLYKGVRAINKALFYTAFLPWACVIWLVAITYFLGFALQIVFPVIVLASLTAALVSFTRIRQRRANTILGYLDQAIQLNLPIDWMLEAAAASEQGVTRKKLMNLRWELADGHAVATALNVAAPEIGQRRLKIIEAAEHIGQLAPVLNQLQNEDVANNPNPHTFKFVTLIYPFTVMLILSLVVSFVSIFVIPQFEEIFNDFDGEFPPQLLAISEFVTNFRSTIFFVWFVITQLILWFIVWTIFQPKWLTLKPIRRYLDAIIFYTPLFGKLAVDRGLAQALPLLATATQSGVPLESALNEIQSLRINTHLLKQLDRCQISLAHGASLQNATQQAKLPTLLTQMLAPAAHAASVPQTLSYLAHYYQLRYSKSLALLENAAAPTIVLITSVAVGWFVIQLFKPLFMIIDLTVESTGLM